MLVTKDEIKKKNIDELIQTNFNYQMQNDPELQGKIYKKREFYFYKYDDAQELTSDDDLKKYRYNTCARTIKLRSYQALLSNYINPETPYKGLLVFHGTGTGKTCIAIKIAEGFKKMIQQYNTKILVLVPGPLIADSWRSQLLSCTQNTYKEDEKNYYDNKTHDKNIKKGIMNAMQYYRIMSYTSFVKKTLGNKVIEYVKGKQTYVKNENGEYIREISSDAIHDLNNTLCIVDEAHQLTGNDRGEALKYILKKSTNMKLLLLTATPMKNLADDIVELLNYLRPLDSQIKKKKIFDYNLNAIQLRDDGLEYLKKMANGYVSYLRGRDPLTYATAIDEGENISELLYTKVIPSKMLKFQENTYNEMIKTIGDSDKLHKKKESLANFVFPGLSSNKQTLIGYYGKDGMDTIIQQLKINSELLNKKIASDILNINYKSNDLLQLSNDKKNITGKIFNEKYLENFSVKFYNTLKNIDDLVYGKKGARTAFVYSNLVKIGIKLFQEILIQNGYLEFLENNTMYKILPNTKCYFCGVEFKCHSSLFNESSDDCSSTNIKIPLHDFEPATFKTVTGKTTDFDNDTIKEKYIDIIQNVFNSPGNISGRYLKFILGSKVLNEGISLKNVAEVHILDVHFTLGRVYQVIGRAIRGCSHYDLMDDEKYPTVKIYKYVIVDENNKSSEIELYKNAELKDVVIKKIERALKEIAIDCPLNYSGNIFKSEVKQYKNCKEPTDKNIKKDDVICPALCDYTDCVYTCADKKLNSEYYDPNNLIYKNISEQNLDYSTFNKTFIQTEIDVIKEKIKEMFVFKYAYTIEDIISYVKLIYDKNKQNLFNSFFVYRALHLLMPVGINDLINFKDIIYDKYNTPGYLIYTNKYYIFQPLNDDVQQQNINIPMYYRTDNFMNKFVSQLKLKDFVTHTYKDIKNIIDNKDETYEFDMNYYNNRNEYEIVGIIDKIHDIKSNKNMEIFKIRKKRDKILEQKRKIGLQSYMGADCMTTHNKEYLMSIFKLLNIKSDNKTKLSLCTKIKEKLLFLEKYSTGKSNMTYMIIPKNHIVYKFPYNLEDRVKYLSNIIDKHVKHEYINIEKIEKNIDGKNIVVSYIIKIKNTVDIAVKQQLTFIGFNKKLELIVE